MQASTRKHSYGGQIFSTQFQDYARKRLRGRAIEDGAVGCRENPTVARTGEYMLLRPVKDGASCVRAKAAEREEGAFRWMQQKARVFVIGVRDDFHGADGDVSHMRDNFDRVGILSRADEDHKAAESCDEAGGQIFCEPATGELLIVISSDENSPGQRKVEWSLATGLRARFGHRFAARRLGPSVARPLGAAFR